MKRFLLLALLALLLAGCGDKKVVRYYHSTDTLYVCPPCADTARCEEKHDCENKKEEK